MVVAAAVAPSVVVPMWLTSHGAWRVVPDTGVPATRIEPDSIVARRVSWARDRYPAETESGCAAELHEAVAAARTDGIAAGWWLTQRGGRRVAEAGDQLRVELRDRKKRAVIEANAREGRNSEPLEADLFRALQKTVPTEKYNWLWIAFWFGMRPQEVDILKTRVWRDGMPTWWLEDDETTLVVYQPKLQMVKPKGRYRRIPLRFPEQTNALAMIKLGNFERPSIREAAKWLPNRVSLYGCRHGFACYMDMSGIDIYAISRWLGHQSVKTTERYYVRLGMRRDVMASRSWKQEISDFHFVDLLKSLLVAFLQLMASRFYRHAKPLNLPSP